MGRHDGERTLDRGEATAGGRQRPDPVCSGADTVAGAHSMLLHVYGGAQELPGVYVDAHAIRVPSEEPLRILGRPFDGRETSKE